MSSNGYIAVTDRDWYEFLRNNSIFRGINFWRKNTHFFNIIKTGQPIFFLVKNEKNNRGERKLLGQGTYVDYKVMKVKDAWQTYKEKNGCPDIQQLYGRFAKLYGLNSLDTEIGCIILDQVTFYEKPVLLSSVNIIFQNCIVSGKGISVDEVKMIEKSVK